MEYVKLPILSSLMPSQISSAFANAGYLEMLPKTAKYLDRNSRGQFVYECTWFSNFDGEMFEPCNVYVSVNNDGVICADV